MRRVPAKIAWTVTFMITLVAASAVMSQQPAGAFPEDPVLRCTSSEWIGNPLLKVNMIGATSYDVYRNGELNSSFTLVLEVGAQRSMRILDGELADDYQVRAELNGVVQTADCAPREAPNLEDLECNASVDATGLLDLSWPMVGADRYTVVDDGLWRTPQTFSATIADPANDGTGTALWTSVVTGPHTFELKAIMNSGEEVSADCVVDPIFPLTCSVDLDADGNVRIEFTRRLWLRAATDKAVIYRDGLKIRGDIDLGAFGENRENVVLDLAATPGNHSYQILQHGWINGAIGVTTDCGSIEVERPLGPLCAMTIDELRRPAVTWDDRLPGGSLAVLKDGAWFVNTDVDAGIRWVDDGEAAYSIKLISSGITLAESDCTVDDNAPPTPTPEPVIGFTCQATPTADGGTELTWLYDGYSRYSIRRDGQFAASVAVKDTPVREDGTISTTVDSQGTDWSIRGLVNGKTVVEVPCRAQLIVCKVIDAFDNPTLRWNAAGGTSYNVRQQGTAISVWVEMVTAPEPGAIVTSNATLSRSRAYFIRTRIDSVTIDIPCTIELSN